VFIIIIIIIIIMSDKILVVWPMRWVWHVARVEERRSACRVVVIRAERKNSLQCLGIDRKIILKFTMKMSDGKTWTGFSWLKIGKLAECSERAEVTLDFIKFRDCVSS